MGVSGRLLERADDQRGATKASITSDDDNKRKHRRICRGAADNEKSGELRGDIAINIRAMSFKRVIMYR